MTKRKNAGEGYGYMFHGAFKDKKDAVAKERKTKGAWVKGVLTNRGHRYLVMSPRTNPIKRKKRVTPEEASAYLLYDHAREWANAAGEAARRKIAKKAEQMRAIARRENLIDAHGQYSPDTPKKTESYKGYEIQVFGHGRVLVPGSGRTFLSVAKAKRAIDTWEAARARGENPHELLIMGANPSEIDRENTQEISLPPGATIVIRTPRQNPENPDRYTSKHAELSGARYTPPGLIQTKRQRRVAGMVRGTRRSASKHKYDWIPSEGIAPGQNPGDDSFVYAALAELYPGKILNQLSTKELSHVLQRAAALKHPQPRQNITGLELAQIAGGIGGVVPLLHQRKRRKNVELGTFENGVFHPWTRRPKSRQKKAIRRQNSSAATIREDFTGAPSEYVTSANEPHMPAGDYAQLGELLALYVKPVKGGQVMQIDFKQPRPKVVSDESARQIWFFEGDQDVTDSLHSFGAHDRGAGLFELGEARRIDYKQRKEHVPDPDVDEWRHEFGEETGVRPTVLFDRDRKRLILEGGEYEIRREGIVN